MNLYLEILHRYMSAMKTVVFTTANQIGEMVRELLVIFENPYTTYIISLSTLLVLMTMVFFMEQKGY